MRKIPFAGIVLTSQHVNRLHGCLWSTGATGCEVPHHPDSLPYDLWIMHTSLIFKYFLFKKSMYYIQYSYRYSDRLQFEVTKTSTSTTSFRTHNFDHRDHPGTDIHCADNWTYTQNTLHHLISSVAIVRCWRCAWLLNGRTNRPISGSGWFCGTNLLSFHGGDVNTTLSAARYFGLMPYPPQH